MARPRTVLIFGATGSAGGSVLRACLASPDVEEVRAVARRPLALESPKLRAFVHADYADFSAVEDAFANVDACLWCLGISSTQVSGEAEYRRITHDYAVAGARTLARVSPDAVFHYVSGAGAGARSRFMWARVKAETERELVDDVGAVCWRPAAIDGETSASTPRLYLALRPVYRLLFKPFRSLYVAGEEIGLAMLEATRRGMRARVVENAEIRDLADRSRR